MYKRLIPGVVLVLLGALWIAQGTNAVGGSGMSGHSQYAVLGAVVAVVGIALLLWAYTVRRRALQPVELDDSEY